MKINFTDYDLSQFRVQVGTFCGIEDCRLITPQEMGVDWTQQNKIFRSSIWDKDGFLLSPSFPKFVNWFEKPDVFPVPTSLDGCEARLKIDGSTLIFDSIYNRISMRTRGVFSYITQENAADFEYVFKRYPKIGPFMAAMNHISLICEITTPNNQIILDYGDEPDIYLIGAIYKVDYSLIDQRVLDNWAEGLDIKRPPKFDFNRVDSLIGYFTDAQGIEGCCLYSGNGQVIHKIKSAFYLRLHRLKSSLSSFSKVLDLYLSINAPSYDDFYTYLAKTFDFELAEYAAPQMKEVCELHRVAHGEVSDIRSFILANNLNLISRKEAAKMIIDEYGKSTLGLQSIAFNLLNGKAVDNRAVTNLILSLRERNNSGLTDKPDTTDWMDNNA